MIDYHKIAKSIDFYENLGYKRIESPWTVTKEVSNITKPPTATNWTIQEKNKVLVASAEQSFLYLYLKGFLPKGKFQSVTPCFRDETFDKYHTKYFIKNELIITDEVTEQNLTILVSQCYSFFYSLIRDNDDLQLRETDIGWDIELNGVEVGSYGIRHCEYLDWIYGTGIACPRIDIALNTKL